MQIIKCAAARVAGLKRYFTGRPCSHGHLSERRTSTGKCLSCEREWAKLVSFRRAALRDSAIAQRTATAVITDGLRDIVSRASAKALGETHYFTGVPCCRGHISRRKTSSGSCTACSKEDSLKDSAITRRKARAKEHYLQTREEKLAYGKRYRERNRHRFSKWMAEWRKNNPERDRATRRASQSRRRAQGDGVSTKEMKTWVRKQRKVCYWCGARCEKKYHIDHYEPLSKGGKHAISNFVIACPKCNLTKNAKDPYEFAVTVGRLF